MRGRLLVIFCTLCSGVVVSQPGLSWAVQFGGSDHDIVYSVTTDYYGNVYATGCFLGTVDFDPGPGTYYLSSTVDNSIHYNVFVLKLNSAGTLMWARKLCEAQTNYGPSISVDKNQNVVLTGWFYGTTDFDPGPSAYNLSSAGNNDIFICKLNANGNFVWAVKVGSSSADLGNSIGTDANGNVYTGGVFSQTADFDPGPGTYNLTAMLSWDAFIMKLDSNGQFIWADCFGGSDNDELRDLVVSQEGNVYMTGLFTATADLDPGTGTSYHTAVGYDDLFVIKLNPESGFCWAISIGSTGEEHGFSIDLDEKENVYSTGVYSATADFDPGSGVFLMSGGGAYISKLDSSGKFLFAKELESNNGGPIGLGIAVSNDRICSTGFFGGTGDFDPGPGNYSLSSSWYDVYIHMMDTAGNFLCAGKIGGWNYDWGYSIAADPFGGIYAGGYFTDSTDFDPGPGAQLMYGAGEDGFIVKMNSCLSALQAPELAASDIQVFPNPSPGSITVSNCKFQSVLSIFDSKGKKVFGGRFYSTAYTLETGLPPGVYFVSVETGKTVITRKLVIGD